MATLQKNSVPVTRYIVWKYILNQKIDLLQRKHDVYCWDDLSSLSDSHGVFLTRTIISLICRKFMEQNSKFSKLAYEIKKS